MAHAAAFRSHQINYVCVSILSTISCVTNIQIMHKRFWKTTTAHRRYSRGRSRRVAEPPVQSPRWRRLRRQDEGLSPPWHWRGWHERPSLAASAAPVPTPAAAAVVLTADVAAVKFLWRRRCVLELGPTGVLRTHGHAQRGRKSHAGAQCSGAPAAAALSAEYAAGSAVQWPLRRASA